MRDLSKSQLAFERSQSVGHFLENTKLQVGGWRNGLTDGQIDGRMDKISCMYSTGHGTRLAVESAALSTYCPKV